MNINSKYLNQTAKEIYLSLRKVSPGMASTIKSDFNAKRSEVDPEVIQFCLVSYIMNEFDWDSPGNRGLGRISEATPRLGAYFRDGFAKLSKDDLYSMEELVTKIIVKAYVYQWLISGLSMQIQGIKSKQDVFNQWVPRMYSSEGDIVSYYKRTDPNIINLLAVVFSDDFDLLTNRFKAFGLSPSILTPFPVEQLLFSYLNVGFVLRLVDANRTASSEWIPHKNPPQFYADWQKYNPNDGQKQSGRYVADFVICNNDACESKGHAISEPEAFYLWAKQGFMKRLKGVSGAMYICPFCGSDAVTSIRDSYPFNSRV